MKAVAVVPVPEFQVTVQNHTIRPGLASTTVSPCKPLLPPSRSTTPFFAHGYRQAAMILSSFLVLVTWLGNRNQAAPFLVLVQELEAVASTHRGRH
jgi:hypothetical protein